MNEERYYLCDWMKVFIGTGGWAYFKVPKIDPLKAYSKAFDYVEVNSTFYNYPQKKMIESWRKRVPNNFEFSVKCHQDLTHKHKMEPIEESHECMSRMVEICELLKANILHIQTPASFELSEAKVERIGDFFSSADLGNVRLAWEIRSDGAVLSDKLLRLMQDFNVVHCVDLSKELPAYNSDVVYTRLFGKGVNNVYQFTDDEFAEIDERAMDTGARRSYYNIHGVRMYKDAARLKTYKETGRFPKVTSSTGLESLKEVLREDAKFPSDKSALIRNQGWKVIDLTVEKRIHAKKMLQKLPEKTFMNVEGVIKALRAE